jgi:thioester reductase-like protein
MISSSELKINSLNDALQWQAENNSDKIAFGFLKRKSDESILLTYGELDLKARQIAAYLQSVADKGDRVILLFPAGLEFISGFFGCLYAGMIAVPISVPRAKNISKLEYIISDSKADIVLTLKKNHDFLGDLIKKNSQLSCLEWIIWESVSNDNLKFEYTDINKDEIAYLQYTSGSTGDPKGVMVSHENVLHNILDVCLGCKISSNDISVSWLPHFHDFCLVYSILLAVYVGISSYLMDPISFLFSPLQWLKNISKYQGTITGAPNFAFNLCVKSLEKNPEEKLNLDCLRVIINGSERIQYKSVKKFLKTFKPFGLSESSILPAYGMAEGVLKIATAKLEDPPSVCRIKKDSLAAGLVLDANDSEQSAFDIVCCGNTSIDTRIKIVNPESLTICHESEIGEIWLWGKTICQGYWNKPEETENTFNAYLKTGDGPFLRSGDLGFLRNDELYITGRLKEMVIIRGMNYYPQDIENIVECSHLAINENSVIAFSDDDSDDNSDGEKLIIVAGIKKEFSKLISEEEVFGSIRKSLSEIMELDADSILLVARSKIPKTSSGKNQRLLCKQMYLEQNINYLKKWEKTNQEEQVDVSVALEELSSEELQQWLLNILAEKINIDPRKIDIQQPFTYYGLDSMTIVNLSLKLERLLKRTIPSSLFYESLTIESFLQFLEGNTSVSSTDISLQDDTTLDLDIRGLNAPELQNRNFDNILLTGATGFLGSYLLKELLQQTDAMIHCLVRADDQDHARKRILKSLNPIGMFESSLARINPVIGDISLPLLGMSKENYQELSTIIDAIYNNAAMLNFVYPYQELRATNVSGTKEIIKFANRKKTKEIHHISSMSTIFQATVDPLSFTSDLGIVDSDNIYSNTYKQKKGFNIGYVVSKWVSEELVWEASRRNIPCCIYRPPLVSGHSKTGFSNTDDYLCRIIKGCILLGAAPKQDIILDISPVDYVGKAIIGISRTEKIWGKGFYLLNPQPVSWNQFIEWLNDFGYPVKLIAPEEWQSLLDKKNSSFKENPLYGLLPFLEGRPLDRLILGYPGFITSLHMIEKSTTGKILNELSVVCPKVSYELVTTYLSYLIKIGFLTSPE